jgi:hypothetical protein
MQTKLKTPHETKVEFIGIAAQLQNWAFDMKEQIPEQVDEIDLLQRGAAAIHFMVEELFGPVDDDDIAGAVNG